jgi:hypothetical protein
MLLSGNWPEGMTKSTIVVPSVLRLKWNSSNPGLIVSVAVSANFARYVKRSRASAFAG